MLSILQNKGEISGLIHRWARFGQGDSKGHIISFGGIGKKTAHILEETVAKWQSYTLPAFSKWHEEKLGVFNFLIWGWILELDVKVLFTFKGPYGMKRSSGCLIF